MSDLFELNGKIIPIDQLRIPWAISFVRYVNSPVNHAFTLIECRCHIGIEMVVVMVRPQVPQRPVYDIKYEEPLLIVFESSNNTIPCILSIRKTFPNVPHLNIQKPFKPKSLCLFIESKEELSLRWTPALLGERILWWLKETALGTLHKEDQALEPFFGGTSRPLILPPDIFSDNDKEILHVNTTFCPPYGEILVPDRKLTSSGPKVTLFPFKLAPQEHGVIHYEPSTLEELDLLCKASGLDLLFQLRKRLQEKISDVRTDSNGTILLIAIPKCRTSRSDIETYEYRAFQCIVKKGEKFVFTGPGGLGEELGVLARAPASSIIDTQQPLKYYPTLDNQEKIEESAKRIVVQMLTPTFILTQNQAAEFSGLLERDNRSVLAIGMGAIGSQIFGNLARQAWGQWVLIDKDYFAPHNIVRHQLFGNKFGRSKAEELAERANEMFCGPTIAEGIAADIFSPGGKSELISKHASAASIIIDMSASVAVSRHVALNLQSNAKRISIFLNPSGSDLVLMSEGEGRKIFIDAIESQYLRTILNYKELEEHFNTTNRIRYGGSCTDISSRLSQELIALHSAIGAKGIRDAAINNMPALIIWRCDRNTMTVKRHEIDLHEVKTITINNWTIIVDEGVISKMMNYRKEKLPNETCGILLGYLDTQRRRIYIVDILPAPIDSVEDEMSCLRGIVGLEETVKNVSLKTMQQVMYIGEWHSHPDGAECMPSQRDLVQQKWVNSKMHPEGRPGLMIIACSQGCLHYLISDPYEVNSENNTDIKLLI